MSMTVRSIHRYPIKGLSAEPLERVMLTVGQCIPHDRRFAIAHAATHIDPANPQWLRKTHFFMLMRDEQLAQLRTRFDDQSGAVTIERAGRLLLSACITDAAGRKALEAFFADFLKDHPDGPPKIVEAPGHAFSDAQKKPNASTDKYVSLVNLASVRELERAAKAPLDPLRFRANVYFEGAPAWSELDWVGSEISLGQARLRIVSPITRCPATAVNPDTAERDLDVPRLLRDTFSHNLMGVYGEVVGDGWVATEDVLLPSL
jgi:uncharacterized protein YcbX